MYILTMVFFININSPAMTTITQEYTSKERCETALYVNRESLTKAQVILASCTLR